ncbi:MAG: hypothetical protein H6807_02915 [Planctomycetes bacterium]|nr:hypothetical protein [Planctomycetota bacterium]
MRPTCRSFPIVLLCAALALLAGAVRAQEGTQDKTEYDVVHLRNGQEIVGHVVEETDSEVTILFRGGEMVFPKRLVKEIVRAERREVEKKALANSVNLGRYEDRNEYYFLFYRGKRVGWRETSLEPDRDGEAEGYRFRSRTVFVKEDGKLDMDIKINEFVDRNLHPLTLIASEESGSHASITSGVVDKGHLELAVGVGADQVRREILFSEDTQFLQSLIRQLADTSHFPAQGQSFKVYDSVRGLFVRVRATRNLRKEIVAGKHQFVTVWHFDQGKRSWEVWIDGYGGIVREELGGPHMVALRADPEKVSAFARGEEKDGDGVELTLDYENVPAGFKLSRPNLTWSFEFPEVESPVAITLLNPTLQASVDTVVFDRVAEELACETVTMDLMARMERKSDDFEVVWQRPENIGGTPGITFECVAEHKGTRLRSLGAVVVHSGRGYALLMAAPEHRFAEARPQLERILASFELRDAETVQD